MCLTARLAHLACPIIASCDEAIARFVEGAVSEWEDVGAQYLQRKRSVALIETNL